MSRIIDAPAESSTASLDVNEGFAEFQAEQRAARNSSGLEVETPTEKEVPGSEPVKEPADKAETPKQEPLTPEQLREQKRASNERRHAEREREIQALKAEVERLKTGKAAPAESAPAPKLAVIDPDDPEPQESDFTDKPNGFREYVKAMNAWDYRQNAREAAERNAVETQQRELKTSGQTFMGEIGEYAKAHPGFIGTEEEPGSFEIVRDELEDGLQEVSAAIVEHEKRAELIDFLGTNQEALDRILAHRGNPTKALIELGKVIAAEFDAPEPPVAETRQRRPPKPPMAVTGRGHTPSGEAALDAAAEANDFTAFQKTLRAREKAGRG